MSLEQEREKLAKLIAGLLVKPWSWEHRDREIWELEQKGLDMDEAILDILAQEGVDPVKLEECRAEIAALRYDLNRTYMAPPEAIQGRVRYIPESLREGDQP